MLTAWVVRSLGVAALAMVATAATLSVASAQDAPPTYKASPDVYQVIAESDGLRLILARWKPGQRDNWHSLQYYASYVLTDCRLRLHFPTGGSTDVALQAEQAFTPSPITSRSMENIGDKDCRILYVERK